MTDATMHPTAGIIPPGWTPIPGPLRKHPLYGALGALARNNNTGQYCMFMGGSARLVSQRWAKVEDQEQAGQTIIRIKAQ